MDTAALPQSLHFDTARFGGTTMTAGSGWQTWKKPLGKSYAIITVFGGGGGGGAGAIGAASTAAGGGGGGSGGMTIVEIPLAFLPSGLFISVGAAKSGAGLITYVSMQPNISANHIVAVAGGGSGGGNAAGATAGTGGSAGAGGTAATMPFGWAFAKLTVAGRPGTAGGTVGNAPTYTLPTTGVRINGGTGGGGLPASGVGSTGGSYSVPASTYYFANDGGVGASVSTAPPDSGKSGVPVLGAGGDYYYGATGGGSTHVTATGAGLVSGAGGNGAVGSGGGGSGGALTGSAAASLSLGGPGLVIITCY
jgi:hypothetical protein